MVSDQTLGRHLRHVVLFGFRAGTTDDEIAEIARRFAELPDLIPGISGFEWGRNNSPEGKSQGLSHCFLVTFETEDARDAYLPHPDHVAFATWARQWIERVTVVDYWADMSA
jgi:hypothetical protein